MPRPVRSAAHQVARAFLGPSDEVNAPPQARTLAREVASASRAARERYNLSDMSARARVLLVWAALGLAGALIIVLTGIFFVPTGSMTDPIAPLDLNNAFLAKMGTIGWIGFLALCGTVAALLAGQAGFPDTEGRVLAPLAAGTGLMPALALLSENYVQGWIGFVATVVAIVWAAAWRRAPVGLAVTAFAPWVLAMTAPPVTESVAMFRLGLYASFLAGVIFPVVMFVQFFESAARRMSGVSYADSWVRSPRATRWVTWAVIMVALVVLASRFTVANELFGEDDGFNWYWDDPVRWVHALGVGVAVVWAVARSYRRPVRSTGVAAITTITMVLATVTSFAGLVIGTVTFLGGIFNVGSLANLDVEAMVHMGYVALLLVLVWWARPGAPRAVLSWSARIMLLALGPGTLATAWPTMTHYIPRFWSSAALQIFAIALVAAIAYGIGEFRRQPLLPAQAVRRLVIIPGVIGHAGVFLPAALASAIGPLVLLGAALLEFVQSVPPRRPGHTRDGELVNGAATSYLLVAMLVLAMPIGLDPEAWFGTIIMLMATVPLSMTVLLHHTDRQVVVRA